ncbi:response regulator [Rhizobium sullae]|nr:response regulator [Rhizobium sullae]
MPPNALIGIIDDDADFLAAISSLVRSLGCKVEGFNSAELFFDRGRVADFSCVISDIHMPKTDGFELTRILRRMLQDLPIILMTGRTGPDTERKAYNCGATVVMSKPFGFEDLTASFQRIGIMRK